MIRVAVVHRESNQIGKHLRRKGERGVGGVKGWSRELLKGVRAE